jgi:hypothetical protein
MAGSIKIQHGATASTPQAGFSTLWVRSSDGEFYYTKPDGSSESLVGATGPTGINTSIVLSQEKTSNYTLAASDVNQMVIGASAAALTFTVNTNALVPIATGSQILITRGGTGALGITGAAGVTINAALGYLQMSNQYSGATLIKQATDTWYLFGDLKA